MLGLDFEDQPPLLASAPTRTDVACFVGWAGRQRPEALGAALQLQLLNLGWPSSLDPDAARERLDALPGALLPSQLPDWLAENGWEPEEDAVGPREILGRLLEAVLPLELVRWIGEKGWATPPYQRPVLDLVRLRDVPVPLASWEEFNRLFSARRPSSDPAGPVGYAYLAMAVRSFFAQGGRKCYVVSLGEPSPFQLGPANLEARRGQLLPGLPATGMPSDPGLPFTPVEREDWSGLGHLFSLPDVSFLCLPDLPELYSVPIVETAPPEVPPEPIQQFKECAVEEPVLPDRSRVGLRAPRCDEAGYRDWAGAARAVVNFLRRHRPLREIQFIASVPLPDDGEKGFDLMRLLVAEGQLLAQSAREDSAGAASAFLQLAYPWLRTEAARGLPEQLEGPDGVLAGLLADNALTRGTFRSATHRTVREVFDVLPPLRRAELYPPSDGSASGFILRDRISLIGPTPTGFRLLSDVTASGDESYRPANVNRLVSVLVRVARHLGEDLVFEPSGQALWRQLREGMERLLAELWRAGALAGATSTEAFQVRCDRSTMTQNDLDAGRVIVVVQFQAAAPIERITVALSMEDGVPLSVLAGTETIAPAA
jgi:Bacteriophage tail sheath protein